MSRQSLTDRMIVEIVMRHRDKLLEDGESKERLEARINYVIDRFVKRTGRQVEQIRVQEKNGKYKLVLEIK